MALHWKHIKGMNGSAPLYTYIKFKEVNDSTKEITAKTENAPQIYLSYNNYDASVNTLGDGDVDLGSIITSKAESQSIKSSFTFEDTVSAPKICGTKSKAAITLGNTVTIDTPTEIKGNLTTTATLAGSTLKVDKDATIDGSIKAGSSCEALFFNALSDRRAKENIKPFSQKALDIISKLQTYTYDYISNKQKSYGIMAQDLLHIDIDGFSFIENSTASGQSGDFMSIKEDKLIYLLLEGIKEQQEEIKQLRLQVEELQNERCKD